MRMKVRQRLAPGAAAASRQRNGRQCWADGRGGYSENRRPVVCALSDRPIRLQSPGNPAPRHGLQADPLAVLHESSLYIGLEVALNRLTAVTGRSRRLFLCSSTSHDSIAEETTKTQNGGTKNTEGHWIHTRNEHGCKQNGKNKFFVLFCSFFVSSCYRLRSFTLVPSRYRYLRRLCWLRSNLGSAEPNRNRRKLKAGPVHSSRDSAAGSCGPNRAPKAREIARSARAARWSGRRSRSTKVVAVPL